MIIRGSVQHAIKNIGQKVLNLGDITLNKWLGNLTARCFDMPNALYYERWQPFIKIEILYPY